jgi:hypothetical protein
MRHAFVIIVIAAWAAVARAQDVPQPDTVSNPAGTRMPLFAQQGLWAIGGAHIGTPSILSLSAGGAYGLGPHVRGSVFADVEPGLTAIRLGAGYLLFDDQVIGAGAAVRFTRLRSWVQALGVKRGPWYSGVDVTVMMYAANLRIGGYAARSREGDPLGLVTVDVGIGF